MSLLSEPTPFPTTHAVLPADAIALLQRAARTPIPVSDPLARVRAIEQATKRVQQQYPAYFQKEQLQ